MIRKLSSEVRCGLSTTIFLDDKSFRKDDGDTDQEEYNSNYNLSSKIKTATAGSDEVQSERPIFDNFFQHLGPYIGNNTANVVFQMVKRLWLIRIDQWLYIAPVRFARKLKFFIGGAAIEKRRLRTERERREERMSGREEKNKMVLT
ncbi:hypothetical protein TNCV_5137991 [Trichonephila clavipes]|nr:hypothetical protein TNCV_5137991 [Trichonephila clavipes]